jgi:hypothetical protein
MEIMSQQQRNQVKILHPKKTQLKIRQVKTLKQIKMDSYNLLMNEGTMKTAILKFINFI